MSLGTSDPVVGASPDRRSESLHRYVARLGRSRVLRRLGRNRLAMLSLVSLAVLICAAIAAPLLAPYDPDALGLKSINQGPSDAHWLGTDYLGRDTLSRLLYAARVTLTASFVGIGTAVAIGVPVGLIAGHLGGIVESWLNRLFDALLSLPPLIFAIGIIGFLGPGLTQAMIAVGFVIAPRFYRVAATSAAAIRTETYIEACHSMGFSTPRILFRHVLPNVSGPLLVQFSFGIGVVISSEASLSFIGLGVQLPNASWGSMLGSAFQHVADSQFQLVPPALMLTLTILWFFLLGDALRDALGRTSE